MKEYKYTIDGKEYKVSYIPVDHHQVALREIFTRQEAQEMLGTEELKKNPLLKEAVEYVLRNEEE